MQRDQKRYEERRLDYAKGVVPDLQTVELSVLFEPFWADFFGEDQERRIVGANGLLRYRAQLEKRQLGAPDPGADAALEGLTPEELEAMEDI